MLLVGSKRNQLEKSLKTTGPEDRGGPHGAKKQVEIWTHLECSKRINHQSRNFWCWPSSSHSPAVPVTPSMTD